MIAAIYRDGGYEPAADFIRRHWVFDAIKETTLDGTVNPKTRLSDWCGANRAPYAVYSVVDQSGPEHAPVFTVEAKVDGYSSAVGKGGNKQEAEIAAATSLLDFLSRTDRHNA